MIPSACNGIFRFATKTKVGSVLTEDKPPVIVRSLKVTVSVDVDPM